MHCTTSRRRGALAWTLATAALLSIGCRGEDISNDCELQGQAYFQRTEQEAAPLISPVPESGPYPVALQLTEDATDSSWVWAGNSAHWYRQMAAPRPPTDCQKYFQRAGRPRESFSTTLR